MTEKFFEQQLKLWPLAADNYKAVRAARSKSFSLNRSLNIELKCLPQRKRSATADTSRTGIAARPCFLCAPQLPAEQISLNLVFENEQITTCTKARENGYRLLVNPYPAFDRHFTIAAVDHREQSLSRELPAMLALTEFMPSYLFFFNAPGAGASAPDHLHFQAVPRGCLPVERDFASWHDVYSRVLFTSGQTEVFCLENFLRSAWLLKSRDPKELCALLQELLGILASSLPNTQTETSTAVNNIPQTIHGGNIGSTEKFHTDVNKNPEATAVQQKPPVNLLSWYEKGLWTCVLFARSKHRPACYFETGEQQIIVSPASVEMGGLIVLIRPEDFDKINPGLISRIFAEVSLPKQAYNDISEAWKNQNQHFNPRAL